MVRVIARYFACNFALDGRGGVGYTAFVMMREGVVLSPNKTEQKMAYLSSEQIHEVLNKIDSYGIQNEKVLEIVKSMRDQFARKGSLSEKQTDLLVRFEKQNNPENMVKRSEWESNWDAEKREKFLKVVEYYRMNPPFYAELIKMVDRNPNYIPSQETYEKMMGNKFIQSFFKKTSTAARWNVGQMVKLIRAGILEGYRGSVYGLDTTDPAVIYCNVMEVNVDAKGYCYTLRNLNGKIINVHEIGISKRAVDESEINGED